MYLKRDWIASSKYTNHPRLNNQHDRRGPERPLDEHKDLPLWQQTRHSFKLQKSWNKKSHAQFRLANHLALTSSFVSRRSGHTICEWNMVRCGSENIHQKEMYSKEIGSHAQNMLTILGSTINMMIKGGPEQPLDEHEDLQPWQWTRLSFKLQKSWNKWPHAGFRLANCLALGASFVSRRSGHTICEWNMVRCKHTPKRDIFKRDWIACSKYANHPRLNSQHDRRGPERPLDEHKDLPPRQWTRHSFKLQKSRNNWPHAEFKLATHLALIASFVS